MTDPPSALDLLSSATEELNAATEAYSLLRAEKGYPDHVPAVVRSEDDPIYQAFMRVQRAHDLCGQAPLALQASHDAKR